MKNWEKIFTTPQMHQAELTKALLIANDIEAIVLNKQDSMYHWGYFEVYVNQEDKGAALIIIQDVTEK